MRRFTFKALVVSMAMAFALPAAQAARAHKDAEGSKSARVQAKAKVASSRKAKVIHATLTTKRRAAAQRVAYASAMAGVPPVPVTLPSMVVSLSAVVWSSGPVVAVSTMPRLHQRGSGPDETSL